MRGWPGAEQTQEAILCPDQNEMRLSRGPGPWEIQLGNPLSPLRRGEGMGMETEPGRVQPGWEQLIPEDSNPEEAVMGERLSPGRKGMEWGCRAVSSLDRVCPAHREGICYPCACAANLLHVGLLRSGQRPEVPRVPSTCCAVSQLRMLVLTLALLTPGIRGDTPGQVCPAPGHVYHLPPTGSPSSSY